MKLLQLFEALEDKDIQFWTKYAGHRDFPSEEEARDFLARKYNLGSAWTMGIDNPKEYYANLAREMPVFQTKKGWRIGTPQILKRIQGQRSRTKNPRLSWKTIDIRQASLREMNDSAAAQEEEPYKILPVKMYRIAEVMPDTDNDSYMNNPKERSYIEDLAKKIKQNRWFEAVFIHENYRYVIEGQHRTRALKLLGFKTVPGNGFLYDLDDMTNEGYDNANFLSKDLGQGPTIYPLPTDTKKYRDIDSKRRGGNKLKVKTRDGNKNTRNVEAKHAD